MSITIPSSLRQNAARLMGSVIRKTMGKYGAEHPDVVDFLTEKDSICTLYIVQSVPLTDELTLKLQEKLNNYLAFALDGQLAEEYPQMEFMKLKIRIELQYKPEGVAAHFLEMVPALLQEEGIAFEVQIGGQSQNV